MDVRMWNEAPKITAMSNPMSLKFADKTLSIKKRIYHAQVLSWVNLMHIIKYWSLIRTRQTIWIFCTMEQHPTLVASER